MATTTANEQYSLDMKLLNSDLNTLVNECYMYYTNEINKTLSDEKKWTNTTLYPGQYGYDAIAVSLAYTVTNMKEDAKEKDLAILIHDAWIVNYVFWRDNKPYESDKNYKKPYNGIENERRNKCATSSYDELDDEEKEKDLYIARFIKSKIM